MTRASGRHFGELDGRRSRNGDHTRQQLRRIRRRSRKLIIELDLPVPFDVEGLCAQVGARRGTTIRLHPAPTQLDGLCGVVFSMSDEDHIVYESQTSPLHQVQIILHELGHLLCGHRVKSDGITEVVSRTLFPNLDPAKVNMSLGGARSHYSDPEELEAEVIASMILQRARHTTPALARTMYSDIADRVEHALE